MFVIVCVLCTILDKPRLTLLLGHLITMYKTFFSDDDLSVCVCVGECVCR